MDEGQIKNLIAQLTVRVKVSGKKADGRGFMEKGTGVLLLQDNRAYVLTVYHCIYGEKKPFHTLKQEDIKFSFLSVVCPQVINPIKISPLKQNLVLMEIDIQQLNKTDMKCHYLNKVYDGEQYYLRGFPKSEVHNFEAKCNDTNFDEVTFKIDVDRLTDDIGGENAKTYIGGLSGAGVFFSEYNNLYLIGLANALRDKYGRFNTIHCTKLVALANSDINLNKRLVFEDYKQNIELTEVETLLYKNQLIKAYNSDSNNEIISEKDIYGKYIRHFKNAETSFHKVEVLRRFTRDTLGDKEYEDFQEDMYQGIMNTVDDDYENNFKKVKATEDKASDMPTEYYPLNKKCEKIEKKGVCHHLVQDKIISWIDDE